LKAFLQQNAIASILQSHSTYYVQIDQKTQVLFEFYLPIHAKPVASISQIPPLSYAWIYANQSPKLSRPHRIIGAVEEYQLIQFIP
jgi:hypothetical protein